MRDALVRPVLEGLAGHKELYSTSNISSGSETGSGRTVRNRYREAPIGAVAIQVSYRRAVCDYFSWIASLRSQ
jgi:hypothetical protein